MPIVLAPAEVLAGLIAICVLLCAVLIANICKAVFSAVPIPVIGGAIASAFDWLASHALSAMSWLWDKTNPVAVFTAMVHVLHATEQGLHTVVFGDVYNALSRIVTVTIPQAFSAAVSRAGQFANAVLVQVAAVYNWAVAEFNAVRAQIVSTEQAVQGWALAQIGAAVRTVENDLAAVWGRTQALVSAAIAAATSSIMAAMAALRTEVLGRIGGLEADLTTVETVVTATVLPELAVLTRDLTTTIERVTTTEECVGPICGPNLGPTLGDLGKLLQSLEQLVDAGLLLALAVAAYENPQAVADDVLAVTQPFVDTGRSLLRDAGVIAA